MAESGKISPLVNSIENKKSPDFAMLPDLKRITVVGSGSVTVTAIQSWLAHLAGFEIFTVIWFGAQQAPHKRVKS